MFTGAPPTHPAAEATLKSFVDGVKDFRKGGWAEDPGNRFWAVKIVGCSPSFYIVLNWDKGGLHLKSCLRQKCPPQVRNHSTQRAHPCKHVTLNIVNLKGVLSQSIIGWSTRSPVEELEKRPKDLKEFLVL